MLPRASGLLRARTGGPGEFEDVVQDQIGPIREALGVVRDVEELVEQRCQPIGEAAAFRQPAQLLQESLFPNLWIVPGFSGSAAQEVLEWNVGSDLVCERGDRFVAADRQQRFAPKKPDELVRIFGPNGIVVVDGQAAHPMGKRDELVPVDLAPAAYRGQSFFQRSRELFVAIVIKRLGGKPFSESPRAPGSTRRRLDVAGLAADPCRDAG